MTPTTPRRSPYLSSVRASRATPSTAQTPRGFYGRATESEDHWQPGDVIVPRSQDDAIDELKRSVHSMISDMQTALSSEFQCLQESVHALTERVHVVEMQLKESPTPSSSGSEFDSPHGRKRRISLELQLCVFLCTVYFKSSSQSQIREVYKNLPGEKKLKLNER